MSYPAIKTHFTFKSFLKES